MSVSFSVDKIVQTINLGVGGTNVVFHYAISRLISAPGDDPVSFDQHCSVTLSFIDTRIDIVHGLAKVIQFLSTRLHFFERNPI